VRNNLSNHHYAIINGRRLAYRTAGPSDASPIVLIHALASRSESWDKTSSALVRLGYRVIVPDLRGHGRSDWANSYSLAEFEHDLVALLDELNLERVDFVGHSLGGHLVLRIAATVPHRVGRCVVEATPVPPRDEADAASLRARTAGPWWRRSLRTLGAARILRLVLLRQFDFRAARPVLREFRSPMQPWWCGLDLIQSPTLLLASKNDGTITERIGLLSSRIAGAKSVILGEGHHLHTNYFDDYLIAVSAFLMEGTSPSRAESGLGRVGQPDPSGISLADNAVT
jgi:esterase